MAKVYTSGHQAIVTKENFTKDASTAMENGLLLLDKYTKVLINLTENAEAENIHGETAVYMKVSLKAIKSTI